jgi:hypothetical protein
MPSQKDPISELRFACSFKGEASALFREACHNFSKFSVFVRSDQMEASLGGRSVEDLYANVLSFIEIFDQSLQVCNACLRQLLF